MDINNNTRNFINMIKATTIVYSKETATELATIAAIAAAKTAGDPTKTNAQIRAAAMVAVARYEASKSILKPKLNFKEKKEGKLEIESESDFDPEYDSDTESDSEYESETKPRIKPIYNPYMKNIILTRSKLLPSLTNVKECRYLSFRKKIHKRK